MDKSSEMKSDKGKGGKNREGYGGCIHVKKPESALKQIE